jgi:hypothetical protein
MATAPLGPPPQSLRSIALAGNTRLPNRIRRRPGEPTDNLTKPDYVGQASRRYPFSPSAEPDSCSLQPAPLFVQPAPVFDLLITNHFSWCNFGCGYATPWSLRSPALKSVFAVFCLRSARMCRFKVKPPIASNGSRNHCQ